jgi:hypothetical protein
MILAALELELEQYVQALRHVRDEQGHAMVVRNGRSHHGPTVNLGAGPVRFRAPRVDDRRPEHRYTSKILPPYMRRSPRLEEALPVLYLRGARVPVLPGPCWWTLRSDHPTLRCSGGSPLCGCSSITWLRKGRAT